MLHRQSLALLRLSFACLAILGALAPTVAWSKNLLDVVERPEDDLLVLSLNIGKTRILDALLAYEDLKTEKYYLPFSDFIEALNFPIDVNNRKGEASGWFLSEDRKFNLDLSNGVATIEGLKYELSNNNIEYHEDGIYVSLETLEEWFPLTLDIDYSQLALIVKSLEPLPIEIQMAREQKHKAIKDQKRAPLKEYPIEDHPAPFLSLPFIDVTAQMGYEHADTVTPATSAGTTVLASGIIASQDFKMSINDNTRSTSPPEIRATLSRQDPQRNLLGIGLSEYEFGDVNTTSLPLIARGQAGRGISFSNFPINSSSSVQSGQIRLRGNLPIGYQVDVSRNGQLLGFLEEPDDNGEYIFDLDVLPGLNIFELVFYGSHGQKEIKEERIYVPANAISKGSFHFKGDIIQGNTNLFDNRQGGNDEDNGKYRGTIEAEYGLDGVSSLYVAGANVTQDGKRSRYGLLRYSRSFRDIRTDLTYAKSISHGQAAGIRLQSIYKGLSWQVEHEYFNEFVSEQTENYGMQGQIKHATTVKLSGATPFIKNIPFSFNLDRLVNKAGDIRSHYRIRLTENISKLRVTEELESYIENNKDTETNFNLQLSSRLSKVNLRSNFNYEIQPDRALTNLGLQADWKVNKKSVVRIGFRRSGADNPVNTASLGLNYDFDYFKLGLNNSYNNNNEFRTFLNLSFGLAYDPSKSNVFMTKERLSQSALILPEVFYDKNNNNIFDDQDEWMENVRFEGNGIDKTVSTNEDGKLRLVGINPYKRVGIKLNESTLPDPYMRSKTEPSDLILRPSQVVKKNFPVILVGEVDSEIVMAKYGLEKPAQSIHLEIKDKNGNIVESAKSEYDGFVWVQNIPMGNYTASLNAEQISSLGYCMPNTQSLTLNTENPFISLKKFILWPQTEQNISGIELLASTDISELKEYWQTIKPTLENHFLDPRDIPYSYITQNEDVSKESYRLIVTDVDDQTASIICEELKGKCDIINHDSFGCPQQIKSVE